MILLLSWNYQDSCFSCCWPGSAIAGNSASANPYVAIKLAPVPQWLKSKVAGRTVTGSGVAPLGTDQKNVWVVCYEDQKTKTAFAEFWKQSEKNQSHRLLRASLTYSDNNSLTDYYDHLRMCWLFPARHAGPVVSTIWRANEQRIYTFEKGWNDLKPVIQDVQYVRGETSNPFDFNSADERGIAQGVVFVEYHMTAPEDLPGENYFLYWHRGQGWFASSEKAKPKS